MRYLHTMVRVKDIDQSLDFYCNKLGLKEVRRHENEQGRYTLIFLAAPAAATWSASSRRTEFRSRYRKRGLPRRRRNPGLQCRRRVAGSWVAGSAQNARAAPSRFLETDETRRRRGPINRAGPYLPA